MRNAKERLTKRYSKEACLNLTQVEIANELGITQSRVSSLLRELGWQTQWTKTQSPVEDQCIAVLEFIKENGGTVTKALESLEIKVHPQEVRRYAKETGFNLKMYRNAYQRFGLWMLLPCVSKPMYTADFQVDAICLGCNTIHKVLISNLRWNQSMGCRSCARKDRKHYKVKCEQTGAMHRSIRAFANSINHSKRYQQIRLKLLKEGQITIDDKTYSLKER